MKLQGRRRHGRRAGKRANTCRKKLELQRRRSVKRRELLRKRLGKTRLARIMEAWRRSRRHREHILARRGW